MQHFELTREMFVTHLTEKRRISYTKFSLKEKMCNNLKRTPEVKRMRRMGRKKKQVYSSNFRK
jgi:hypothetical protein